MNSRQRRVLKRAVQNVIAKSKKVTDDEKKEMETQTNTEKKYQDSIRSLLPNMRARVAQLWKQIPGKLKAGLAIATLSITLLEGYPWLSIQRDDTLDPNNPFSTLFSVSNEGYLPITNLNAVCHFTVDFDITPKVTVNTTDNIYQSNNFAKWLGHGQRATIPCFGVIEHSFDFHPGPTAARNIQLGVDISYAFPLVNIRILRKSQRFDFKAIIGKDGSQHWTFTS